MHTWVEVVEAMTLEQAEAVVAGSPFTIPLEPMIHWIMPLVFGSVSGLCETRATRGYISLSSSLYRLCLCGSRFSHFLHHWLLLSLSLSLSFLYHNNTVIISTF